MGGRCPECRNPTATQTVIKLRDEVKRPDIVDPVRQRYGSKISKVIEKIKVIQAAEGASAKCVVFIQWDTIVTLLSDALKSIGMSPLVLRGNLLHRQRLIARFVDTCSPETSILLLSLKQSPTGMNLVR